MSSLFGNYTPPVREIPEDYINVRSALLNISVSEDRWFFHIIYKGYWRGEYWGLWDSVYTSNGIYSGEFFKDHEGQDYTMARQGSNHTFHNVTVMDNGKLLLNKPFTLDPTGHRVYDTRNGIDQTMTREEILSYIAGHPDIFTVPTTETHRF